MLPNIRRRLITVGAAVALAIGLAASTSAAAEDSGGWVGSWEAAPANGVPNTDNGYPNFSIRNVVHTSVGGDQARIRLSNRYGKAPLTLGHVTVGVQAAMNSADAVSVVDVTFHGAKSTTIPAGADLTSDPVAFTVPANTNLLVTTYVPTPSGPVTFHPLAEQTSFFTRNGDHAGEASGAAFTEKATVWHYVTGVDVRDWAARGSVVTLGDSITDGANSTPNANHRWPDYLAQRLLKLPPGRQLGVQNAGISGNRLLLDGGNAGEAATKRFDEDVLSRTGVRSVIIFEGVNDLQQDPHQTDPAKVEAALKQLVDRAHARGLKVIGATITPFKGWYSWSDVLEATRNAVNKWIRTSRVYDTVVDFDKTIADPADPQRMLPAYDSGDHLHPGDVGFQTMAGVINLNRL